MHQRQSLHAFLTGALVLAVAVAAPAAADAPPGPDPLITNVDGRRTTSLDGIWRTIVDAFETGYYDYRYQPRADGYFLDRKAEDETDRVEYSFDTSPTLLVPGDWNTQRESLLLYEGTVWYRRTFDDPRESGTSRLFVWFGAVASKAHVFLNGELLGVHEGAFTPFNFEITDRVKPTDNVLVVKADNARRPEAVPTLDFDWWNYGGITRPVRLVEVPGTFIRDFVVQLAKGSRDRVRGWVTLDGTKAGQEVTVRIAEAGISETATTDGGGRAAFDFPARLDLWSPEDPKLYDVEVAAGQDVVQDRIGFRSLETRGTTILLNGKAVFLRGICVHGEAPYRSGRAFGVDDARTLLGWVKALGGNFVRLAHYPHDEAMLREADRMGLLVWSEIPVYWAIRWESPDTLDNARTQLTESITRDRNRASIALWSVANETPISDPRNAFLKALVDRVRELDDTRLVTAALERGEPEGDTQVIDDPFGKHLDVIGCNEYVGWYDGLAEKADRVSWRSVYEKPHIMSEWGAGARYGRHGTTRTRWSEEFQAEVYRRQAEMLDRIPFLAGTSPWLLMDFRSPHRLLPGVQDGWNRKGVVSDRGERKKAFFVLREWYGRLAEGER
ncbi:MAG: beta-glucuronidase [Acidobacteria bacterium]|nr:beta-glucuronidase [Acidobacteriota bacterium]